MFNGFLLCANLDTLFDRGLLTFDETGRLICSARIGEKHRVALQLQEGFALRWMAPEQIDYLAWHRDPVFVAGI